MHVLTYYFNFEWHVWRDSKILKINKEPTIYCFVFSFFVRRSPMCNQPSINKATITGKKTLGAYSLVTNEEIIFSEVCFMFSIDLTSDFFKLCLENLYVWTSLVGIDASSGDLGELKGLLSMILGPAVWAWYSLVWSLGC